jgi:hypothetical protein
MILSRVLAVLVGLVWGVFVAFNVVFSDVFGVRGMLGAIAYVLVAYFGLGLAFGAVGPKTGWKWTWWLAPPGVILAGLTLSDAPRNMAYPLGVIASVIAATLAGSWLGSYVRMRFRRPDASAGPSDETPLT